jgi:hypothetical protein
LGQRISNGLVVGEHARLVRDLQEGVFEPVFTSFRVVRADAVALGSTGTPDLVGVHIDLTAGPFLLAKLTALGEVLLNGDEGTSRDITADSETEDPIPFSVATVVEEAQDVSVESEGNSNVCHGSTSPISDVGTKVGPTAYIP